jgi:hypothetical protein
MGACFTATSLNAIAETVDRCERLLAEKSHADTARLGGDPAIRNCFMRIFFDQLRIADNFRTNSYVQISG